MVERTLFTQCQHTGLPCWNKYSRLSVFLTSRATFLALGYVADLRLPRSCDNDLCCFASSAMEMRFRRRSSGALSCPEGCRACKRRIVNTRADFEFTTYTSISPHYTLYLSLCLSWPVCAWQSFMGAYKSARYSHFKPKAMGSRAVRGTEGDGGGGG